MTASQRFEFVPPGNWRPIWKRRMGASWLAAFWFQPLHWMVGFDIAGPVACLGVGPLIFTVGRIRPVEEPQP